MRMIATFAAESDAHTVADALYVQGIESSVNETREGQHALWVHDDAHLDAAREMLGRYETSPDAPEFEEARRHARTQRKQREAAEKKSRHRTIQARQKLQAERRSSGTVTTGMIIASVAVFAMQSLKPGVLESALAPRGLDLAEPWRMFTPIFLHLGFLHVLFNMWFLWDFGNAVEKGFRSRYLIALVLVSAPVSILTSFFVFGELAYGMSGVVYALFGFIWMRGKYDPGSPVHMPPSTKVWLLAWLVITFALSGAFGGIAHGAHLGGLAVGMLWGVLSSGYIKRQLR